jgi:ankyrin repeat protein
MTNRNALVGNLILIFLIIFSSAGMVQAASLDEQLLDAVRKRQSAAAKNLIDKGADANTRGAKYITPLLLAADAGNYDVAKYLLNHGAQVDARGW